MDLTQLEMFNAVAESGSITAAAKRVHRVPSNLTTRIRMRVVRLDGTRWTRFAAAVMLPLSATALNISSWVRSMLFSIREWCA